MISNEHMENLLNIIVGDTASEALQYLINLSIGLESCSQFLPMMTNCLVKNFIEDKQSLENFPPEKKKYFSETKDKLIVTSVTSFLKHEKQQCLDDVLPSISKLPNYQVLLGKILHSSTNDAESETLLSSPGLLNLCYLRTDYLSSEIRSKPKHTLETLDKIADLPEDVKSFFQGPKETIEHKGKGFDNIADARKWENRYAFRFSPYIELACEGRGKNARVKLTKTAVFQRAKTYEEQSKEYERLMKIINQSTGAAEECTKINRESEPNIIDLTTPPPAIKMEIKEEVLAR